MGCLVFRSTTQKGLIRIVVWSWRRTLVARGPRRLVITVTSLMGHRRVRRVRFRARLKGLWTPWTSLRRFCLSKYDEVEEAKPNYGSLPVHADDTGFAVGEDRTHRNHGCQDRRDIDFDESGNYSSEETSEEMEDNEHDGDGPGRQEIEVLRNAIAQSLMNVST
ncbi:uncharacterized protein LOC133739688 isoform X2 [Rosa rugosa]|uniref:uncharacterized protein LOC133739688 isoform X2 n=1 Tax=Rosa rugosa TaxID=74645 RepID=UPI002B4127F2|nr:uncharacterized protein LOC133739688 isoform X2 [Rosa rugosa]XP_062023453.1 uncharacterized protein LOC133739688 isoform X2 [Rosa rugosa]XP_062023455.1 uncharacterized protein LOC133739688 isoform X2 [Rosa rugosa]XP_062023456.1 uncharacterized protein LOC133739688 isoform X2 [Rosa rugosa]